MKKFDYSMLNTPDPAIEWFNYLGEILVTEGALLVGDPYTEEFLELNQLILPGTYPVISHFLSNNEVVFLHLQRNEAVRWENATVMNGVAHSWYDIEFQGHAVDSGSTCILNAGDRHLLTTALKENEWLRYVDFLEYGNAFFYIDLSDESFHKLTTRVLEVERELRRVSGWAQTLTATSGHEVVREMVDLYRKFKTFTDYLTEFRITNPEKAGLLEELLQSRAEAVGLLTEWMEENAFSESMASTRKIWDESDLQTRKAAFRRVKHIVFDNDNRSSAFVFQTGNDVYPAFFGYDENGNICNLIMDYGGVGFPFQTEDDNDGRA